MLEQEGAQGHGVEPHAGAAMWGVRFAAAVLHPVVPGQAPPPFPYDTDRSLGLCAHWRDAAFGLGEFAPEPVLRLVGDGEGPGGGRGGRGGERG